MLLGLLLAVGGLSCSALTEGALQAPPEGTPDPDALAGSTVPGERADAGASLGDAGPWDAGPWDAGPWDAGPWDAGPWDAEPRDAEPGDAAPWEPAAPDAAPEAPDAAPPAPPVDCAPLVEAGWSLCAQSADRCEVVFEDRAGCAAVCAAAGLACAAVYENLDGQCAADRAREALRCDPPSNHNSDYCVCARPACQPRCDGRQCGPDDCGGTCGPGCDPGAPCLDGQCRPEAAPWVDFPTPIGYGAAAVGGRGGEICVVRTRDDQGPGSLRACAEAPGPRWIRFAVDGDIALSSPIHLRSQTTLDGRGRAVRITGRGLVMQAVQDVVIHNLSLANGGGSDSEDALRIIDESRHIWIDHVSLSSFPDGLLDITRGSTDVTVSWCHFRNHDKVMLLGASVDDVQDRELRVTLHHNHFERTNQRHPRVRYGRIHVFNNYFERWGSYGIGVSQRAEARIQHNVFRADRNQTAIRLRVGEDPADGVICTTRNLLLNGAREAPERCDGFFRPPYPYDLEGTDGLEARIRTGAGAR